jgi:hypothetical protein
LIEEKEVWGCICFKVLRNNIEQGFFSPGDLLDEVALAGSPCRSQKKNPPFNFKTA